ncbi:DUF3043 domain-containing protein [Cellulomonas bogoriensis]|uniref:Membrane protein n=1 Tax=Cellulomonas bogoriensis 69B4 = DSM 16987 TaxID=1386082 RepID=A0A0A0BTC5_9CELL|nr:DUF3043 domain-containing protein [Cellulomonas bogoriensis]KGM10942.1 membrane protein [Cellulomonas bogoriensis 69B4 = DSM 16987]
MFSRQRSAPEPLPESQPSATTGADNLNQGKGRPTPRRSQAEAARKRPLVPSDRKAAIRAQRAAAKDKREREYRAMQTGDERFMPARDRGPVRRWIRDYVDARRNLGEYFLPVALLMVFSTFVTAGNPTAGVVVILVMYTIVLITIVDAVILSRVLKRRLADRFGAEVPRGSRMYGVMRAFQIRRTRLPRPQVRRGEYPA